jgi:hypothetical protein
LFQQALSYEKTPTLCHTVIAFEAFRTALRSLQDEEPSVKFIIEAGLQKLEEYYQHVLEIPAYVLSAGE